MMYGRNRCKGRNCCLGGTLQDGALYNILFLLIMYQILITVDSMYIAFPT